MYHKLSPIIDELEVGIFDDEIRSDDYNISITMIDIAKMNCL